MQDLCKFRPGIVTNFSLLCSRLPPDEMSWPQLARDSLQDNLPGLRAFYLPPFAPRFFCAKPCNVFRMRNSCFRRKARHFTHSADQKSSAQTCKTYRTIASFGVFPLGGGEGIAEMIWPRFATRPKVLQQSLRFSLTPCRKAPARQAKTVPRR